VQTVAARWCATANLPKRTVQTRIGDVELRVPKVRDCSGGGACFRSELVPPYLKCPRSVEAMIPWLDLKGVETGDSQKALSARCSEIRPSGCQPPPSRGSSSNGSMSIGPGVNATSGAGRPVFPDAPGLDPAPHAAGRHGPHGGSRDYLLNKMKRVRCSSSAYTQTYEALLPTLLPQAPRPTGPFLVPPCTLPEASMTETSSNTITDGKYVELTYLVRDSRTGDVLTEISRPFNYVHGVNEILAPTITRELEGKTQGERVDLLVDCNELYGPRDESLVITEKVAVVPREYRQVGSQILMENNLGQMKSFLVTKIEGDKITFDGNNPLCGREVIYQVKILLVRDATAEEKEHGGKAGANPER